MYTNYRIRGILMGLCLTALTGCLQDQVKEEDTVADIVPGEEQSAPDPDSFVCNPLTGNPENLDRQQGVSGELFYVEPGGPQYPVAADYIANATKIDISLFFNQLYVPTRPFDRGFVTQGGQTITTADGSTLYEWFAIRFNGQLRLAEGQSAGLYQLATLSDDGSVMAITENGVERNIINNDGWHSTQLGCASDVISLAPGQRLPFRLDYFQGPRYHISLVLMWRPLPTLPADQVEPLCGRQGNSFWFNYNVDPPTPTNNYNALLARGWQVIAPENLSLPGTQDENPCNTPAPVISNVAVTQITNSGATINWSTDIVATSQVVLTEVVTGNVTASPEITVLETGHSVVVTGLNANTLYRVKAVSKSVSGRSSESTEITFRTRR